MSIGYGEAVLHGPGVPPGVHVGLAVGVAVGGIVGVGLAQPPPVTLISTDVVVLEPVEPPTATAVLPTCVPAGNARCWIRPGPLLHVSVPGSYTCSALVVSGLNSRFSHALTPALPDVGIVPGPLKGLPPPNTHSLPPITADPGTLTPVGILARVA